ncbi:MAG: arsenate reductase ArsC [Fidelibacterota bacterium]
MKKKVLFICTGNSCRSQMAEGLLRYLAGDLFEVYSAGTHPSHVHPMTIRIMAEWGIDISHHTSDDIDQYLDQGINIVITVCDSAKELCPTFPEKTKQYHWSIPDPFSGWSSEDRFLVNYRNCRNLIRDRVVEFIKNH